MSDPKITPFVEWLGQHQKGEVDTELTYHLRELNSAVLDTGKKGTLTLTIAISRLGETQVQITEDIKVKMPETTRPVSIYFVDNDANLRRDDPRQAPLPFRAVRSAGEAE